MTQPEGRAHIFTLVLDREPVDEELDELFEAGCDDATFGTEPGRIAVAHFAREVEDLTTAVASAVEDVESCGFTVLNVQNEDMVTLRNIADRAGISRESVRRYAAGERGPGDFPAPLTPHDAGTRFYSWVQVARWLDESTEVDVPKVEADLVVADLLIQVRNQHAMSKRYAPLRKAIGV